MPFDRTECKNFAKEWNLNVITSSPYHSHRNGLAEKGVSIAMKMLKKCGYTKSEYQLYLLKYRRNIPLTDLCVSPAELLMNRQLRTKLSIKDQLLKP